MDSIRWFTPTCVGNRQPVPLRRQVGQPLHRRRCHLFLGDGQGLGAHQLFPRPHHHQPRPGQSIDRLDLLHHKAPPAPAPLTTFFPTPNSPIPPAASAT